MWARLIEKVLEAQLKKPSMIFVEGFFYMNFAGLCSMIFFRAVRKNILAFRCLLWVTLEKRNSLR